MAFDLAQTITDFKAKIAADPVQANWTEAESDGLRLQAFQWMESKHAKIKSNVLRQMKDNFNLKYIMEIAIAIDKIEALEA